MLKKHFLSILYIIYWSITNLSNWSLAEELNNYNPVVNNIIHTVAAHYSSGSSESTNFLSSFESSNNIAGVLSAVINSSYNLNSSLANYSLANLAHPIDILQGNSILAVHNDQLLTPAESIAVKQILSDNDQSLILNNLGQAIGGNFNSNLLPNNLNNILIPQGVSLIVNQTNFETNNALVNYGDIVYNNASHSDFSLTVPNLLINESNAMLSTSGNLTISTGVLINEGSIYTTNNLNINTNNAFNTGILESGLGNINFADNLSNNTTIDILGSPNSIIEANNSSINITNNTNPVNSQTDLIHNNYLSRDLNITDINGSINAMVNKVTGLININAQSSHFNTSSSTMYIGDTKVQGDPTYVNTAGDIILAGSITTGGSSLAILASGSISGSSSIDTSSTGARSGSVTIISGLGTSVTGGGINSSTIPNPATQASTTVLITFSGSSSGYTGGSINLPNTTINTSDTQSSSDAGWVTIIALGASGLDSAGSINIGNISAIGTANNGIVTIIGSGNIQVSSINTNGSVSGGGSVSIYDAYPNASSLQVITTGDMIGSATANTSDLTNGTITVTGSITTSNVNTSEFVTIETAGSVNLTGASIVTNTLNIAAATGDIGSSGNDIITAVQYLTVNLSQGSPVYINNTGSITVQSITAGNNNTIQLSTSPDGNGNGQIIINGPITASSGTINMLAYSSGNGVGGIIDLSQVNQLTANTVSLTSTSTSTAANGLDIGPPGQPVSINAANLNFSSAGSARITDSAASLTLGDSNASSSGTVNIAMTGVNSSMNIAGDVSAGLANNTGSIELTVTGTGSINEGTGGLITASEVILNPYTNGNIGSFLANLAVNTANLEFGIPTPGNVYITDSNPGITQLYNSTLDSLYLNDTSGALSLPANDYIQALTGNITLISTALINNGSYLITPDTNSVTLSPAAAPETMGLVTANAAIANYILTPTLLANIRTGELILGSLLNTGGIFVYGSLDASGQAGSAFGTYDLRLETLDGAMVTTNANYTLSSDSIALFSVGGNIGTDSQKGGIEFSVETPALYVNTGSAYPLANAYVDDGYQGYVTLAVADSAGSKGVFSLSMSDNVLGGIIIAADIKAGEIDLTSSGAGTITNLASIDTLDAGTVSLTSNGADIGLPSITGLAIEVNTQNLSVDTTNNNTVFTGSAYIKNNSSAINLTAITVGIAGDFYLTSLGSVTLTGQVTASNIATSGLISIDATNSGNITQSTNTDSIIAGTTDLTSSGGSIILLANINSSNINLATTSNGAITISAKVGNSNSNDTFNASGSGYITTGTNGVIVGNNLNLTSANGEIGFNGNGLITQANNLTFSAGLSVGINNTSSNLNVNTSSTNANLYIYQSGNLTTSGLITAPVLGLYSFNGPLGIGSQNSMVQINAHNIGLESFANGSSVYVNDTYTGNTIMQQSQASSIALTSGGGVLKVNTDGPLSIYAQVDQNEVVKPGLISAQIIAIQAYDNGNGYGIYNEANISSNDFIFLTASQSGYIAQSPTNAIMTAPNIALVTGGGAIGAGSQLLLNSGLVAATTQSNNGFVNIYDEAANSGINGGQSGSYFTFNSNGNLNIYGSIATGKSGSGGAINLSANGVVNIGTTTGINLTTQNGYIFVQNNDNSNGSIHIAKNSFIYTNTPSVSVPGYIVFNIGSYLASNTSNSNPGNISVSTSGPGQVYFGANNILALSGGNSFNALGQNIVFNTRNLPANSITVGGNVNITADPPVITNKTSNYQTENTTPNYNLINTANLYKTNNIDNNIFNQSVIKNSKNYNSFSLSKGSTILHATKNMEITLGDATKISVKLKPGTTILSIVNNGIVTVYNLYDKAKDSVVISFHPDFKPLTLNPGENFILTPNNNLKAFKEVNPLPKTGYRNIKLVNTGHNNIACFKSEFSIPSIIYSTKSLKSLLKSKNRVDKILIENILKTSILISRLANSKGIYENYNTD